MTTPKIEAVAWMVGDEAFPSESLAIEEIRQWGPSGSIAKPVYSQQTVDALLAEVERLRAIAETAGEECGRLRGIIESERREAEANRRDAERLDALEALIDQQPDKALLLHHGRVSNQGFAGLGLGNTNRTIRAAIDAAIGGVEG